MSMTWTWLVVTLVAEFKLSPKCSEIVIVFCCCLKPLLHMPLNPLGILKKGFAEFLGKIKKRKDTLNTKLSQGPSANPGGSTCNATAGVILRRAFASEFFVE